MTHKDAVVIAFARLPVPGKAKTRLAASVGAEAAAAFYKLCAEAVFQQVSRCSTADGMVYCSQTADVAGLQQWLADSHIPMPVFPQQQIADLGARMVAAMTASVCCQHHHHHQQQQHSCRQQQVSLHLQQQQQAQGDKALTLCRQADHLPTPLPDSAGQQQYSAALVVGTDIPDLSAAVVDTAVAALQRYDMVLGPAVDGGYYLIGFRTGALMKPEVQSCQVFDGVVWSTSTVLERTVAAATKAGLQIAPINTLPVLQDVDTVQDLDSWLNKASSVVESSAEVCGQQMLESEHQEKLLLLQYSRSIVDCWKQEQQSSTKGHDVGHLVYVLGHVQRSKLAPDLLSTAPPVLVGTEDVIQH